MKVFLLSHIRNNFGVEQAMVRKINPKNVAIKKRIMVCHSIFGIEFLNRLDFWQCLLFIRDFYYYWVFTAVFKKKIKRNKDKNEIKINASRFLKFILMHFLYVFGRKIILTARCEPQIRWSQGFVAISRFNFVPTSKIEYFS